MTPLQDREQWNKAAEAYDEAARAFTRKYARDALELAGISTGTKVIDVAAGTGALSLEAARQGADVLATDFSPRMVEVLGRLARQESLDQVRTAVMDGQQLGVEDASFDRAFSIFGLIFFPDLPAGFRELHRVLRAGGRAAVAVWTEQRNDLMHLLTEALERGVPSFPLPDTKPPWFSISSREGLMEAMTTAGFDSVNVFTVRHLWVFDSPGGLMERLPNMSPGITAVFDALDAAQAEAYKTAATAILAERFGQGPFALAGDAHIAVGNKDPG